ncbi:hypothetical protein TrVFT333_000763 [Trichoderma virens FT-333]|nr:hypothetical protein TrVFT333_000763 [Trichoderma virens FT-333]
MQIANRTRSKRAEAACIQVATAWRTGYTGYDSACSSQQPLCDTPQSSSSPLESLSDRSRSGRDMRKAAAGFVCAKQTEVGLVASAVGGSQSCSHLIGIGMKQFNCMPASDCLANLWIRKWTRDTIDTTAMDDQKRTGGAFSRHCVPA